MEKKTKIEKPKDGIYYRNFVINRDQVSKDNRTVDLSFSSEEPYERYYETEILDHDKASVKLDRLKLGANLLVDHDRRDVVGVIEKVWIGDDRKGRASVRFGKSNRADEIFNDVLDGIRTSVSVGYRVLERQQEKSDPENPVYRATLWEPMEISLVSIPADTSVGVGRSYEGVRQMEDDKNKSKDAVQKERNRAADIQAYGKQFNCQKEAEKAIKDGTSVEEFRQNLLAKLGRAAKPIEMNPGSNLLGMTSRDINNFSFIRLFNAMAGQNQARDNCFEQEICRAEAERLGREARGAIIPLDVLQNNFLRRDLSTTTGPGGGYLVGTDLLPQLFIDLLRNRSYVMRAGATIISGLVGDIAIPRKSSGSSAYWVSEGVNITESQPAFGQVQGSPKTVGALVEVTRKQRLQSSPDVEMVVRNDMTDGIGVEVDRVCLNGSGSGAEPTGIENTSGIGSDTYTNGGDPSYEDIVNMETNVADNNADERTCAYIAPPAIRGIFKLMYTNATYGEIPVWSEGREAGVGAMNGYRAFCTNQMTSGNVIFGDFSQLLIFEWSVLDILVDPYSLSASGGLRIVCYYDCDIGVRHPAAFSLLSEAAA